jgi:hypothetical protein
MVPTSVHTAPVGEPAGHVTVLLEERAPSPARVLDGAVALNATLVAPAGGVSTMVTWYSVPMPELKMTMGFEFVLAKT